MTASARRILLVEDNEDDVFVIRRSFAKIGVVEMLLVLSDGAAAIDYLAGRGDYWDRVAHPLPSLVLLDLRLPLRSGFEVLAWLRAQPRIGTVPVVVLTSSSEPSDIERAYACGASSYLVKPSGPDEMRALAGNVHLYWLGLNRGPSLDEAG